MQNSAQLNYCSIYIKQPSQIQSSDELKNQLEKGKMEEKIKALKQLIINISHDTTYPQLLMTVIQCITPITGIETQNHKLKSVLLYYWEVLNKVKKDGKMIDTIVLVCNSIRKDLQSSNEYIRGRTLRMVSRLMFRDILEPLVQPILKCLEHKHIYVRRNAVQCIYMIQLSFGDELFTDIEEDVMKLLLTETDLSCKRNAFLLLFQLSQQRAMEYLNKQIELDNLLDLGDILQISILDLFRKVAKHDNKMKSQLLKAVFKFRETKNDSVKMECANTQLQIATTPTTLQRATEIYISLLSTTSNNNLKLVVLQKFEQIQQLSPKYLQDYVPDIVKCLSSSSVEISKKCLNLIIPLANGSNMAAIINTINLELKNIQTKNLPSEKQLQEFRLLLLETLNTFLTKHSQLGKDIIQIITDNLILVPTLDEDTLKLMQDESNRKIIVQKLLQKLENIENIQILKYVFQIIGSNCESKEQILQALQAILKAVGPLPIEQVVEKAEDGEQQQQTQVPQKKIKTKTVVLSDGTYGTVEIKDQDQENDLYSDSFNKSLRKAMLKDEFLGCVLVRNQMKLLNKIKDETQIFNQQSSQVVMVICSLLRQYLINKIDQESINKLNFYLKFLLQPKLFRSSDLSWLYEKTQIQQEVESNDDLNNLEDNKISKAADELINFRALKQSDNLYEIDLADEEIYTQDNNDDQSDFVKKLHKLVQLTGYSDPIYSEAFINIEKHQINFEVLLINRSEKMLQKVYIEFKQQKPNVTNQIIKKAETVNLQPGQKSVVSCALKFSLCDASMIYGSIDYENTAGIEQQYLITKEINVDLIEFIQTANIGTHNFINKWAIYGWENRINVNTNIKSIKDYIQHLQGIFKLSLVEQSLENIRSNYVCFNLYAKTSSEDDFLVNISLDQDEDSKKITGYIRIRSQLEGLVVNLGDKIRNLQNKN